MEVSKAVLVVPRLQLLEPGLYFGSAPYPMIMTLIHNGDDSIGGPLIIILYYHDRAGVHLNYTLLVWKGDR